jgi:hypothetical protein
MTGATLITPSNIPVGNIVRVTILNTGAFAASFPAPPAIRWPLGVVPVLTSGPIKKAVVVFENDGTDILGSALMY